MTTEEYKKAAAYWTSKERKEMQQEQLKPIDLTRILASENSRACRLRVRLQSSN